MPSATFGFLGNPESVDTGNASSSYTVPAGKYVWVSGSAAGGSILINSEVWLAPAIVVQSGNIVAPNTTVTVPMNSTIVGHFITNNSAPGFSIQLEGESVGTIAVASTEFTEPGGTDKGYFLNTNQFMPAGLTLRFVVSGSVQMTYRLVYKSFANSQSVGQMWCKAGDVISATGDATFAVAVFPA